MEGPPGAAVVEGAAGDDVLGSNDGQGMEDEAAGDGRGNPTATCGRPGLGVRDGLRTGMRRGDRRKEEHCVASVETAFLQGAAAIRWFVARVRQSPVARAARDRHVGERTR
jgi:hypothetical protein